MVENSLKYTKGIWGGYASIKAHAIIWWDKGEDSLWELV
jgi:hypothetical protein